ncbi:MAG: three-Cys-motif partner protein TcmP [Nitrospirae bacterium]|nr:three-Cys-motif partner protein TcmP [Nitrospirota bacterium]
MELDHIGIWSEIKLDIIKKYASAYVTIMKEQHWCRGFVYIDAFAGAGKHIRKRTGEMVSGSPLNALEVKPPFTEYHFIDLDKERASVWKDIEKENPSVHAYCGDCNEILVNDIFPTLPYKSHKRALCLLDPYGLHLKWKTIKFAAELKTIDIFINVSTMDINRNILRKELSNVKPDDIERMNAFWGSEDWKSLMYIKQKTLFGDTQETRIKDYQVLADNFCKRLKQAGFDYVAKPLLMRNTQGNNAPLYHLCFASQNAAAKNIAKDIFNRSTKNYPK